LIKLRNIKKEFILTRLRSHTNLGSISNQIQHIFDKTRRYIDKANARGDNFGDLSSVIARMVNDTFNEPENVEKLNENDKLMLIKDIETLLGKSPPNTSEITQPSQSLACKLIKPCLDEDKPKESDPKSVIENVENIVEEEKKVESTTSPSMAKNSPISQEKSSAPPKNLPTIPEYSTYKTPAETREFEEEEEQIEFGSKGKQKWDFFGKLKKFFFTPNTNKDE
jgi:hypothetical protein